jgi:Flp pilus assembly protein CpaB
LAGNRTTNRIFLGTAVLLGVVAMAAAFIYLDSAGGEGAGPKAKILVAKRDLKENTLLDPEKDLTELEIPASFVALKSRALSSEQKKDYKGQRLNRDVFAGTPVLLNDLAALSGTIELRGESRAVSVSVRGANALGGLLVPGDYVMLMVTRPLTAPPGGRPTTAPVAAAADDNAGWQPQSRWETVPVLPTPVRVLAINQRTSRARPIVTAADQYQSASDNAGNQSVMLEVSEAQAKSVLELTGAGQLTITLVLCPPPAR